MTVISRRTVIAGAAATTAVSAVGSGSAPSPALAQTAAPTPLALFVGLSSVLTGIAVAKLNPERDTINVKQAYFDRARPHPAFDKLLQIFADNQSTPEKAADIILSQSGADICYLARSIMLAWYLGAWYEPRVLARYNQPNPPLDPIPFEVISAPAYTQAWIWRVAQAHPMGYSDDIYGYWSEKPKDLDVYIS
jgi:Membrane bound FAD containing D-sorbitol dehydrogenase